VLFERFISRERQEAPDIDVDFEHERREEVLQYLYAKYGRERAGLTAEVICYRSRMAVRDVGAALGLSRDRIDALSRQLDHRAEEPLEQAATDAGLDPEAKIVRRLTKLVRELVGFPRHLSQHVGGMVLSRGPLCETCPIENAAMAERTVLQWDKDDLDALGILKVDCLALGMLTAIRRALDFVAQARGRRLELAEVPAEDPAVYAMLGEADTIGVFQIESRAQMSMLPRLRPACFYDLVIEVAIVRPGPIQGKMVHPYLRRRDGREAVEYPNESVRAVLEKTLGVPIFQEQAMRLAVVAAGFTPGEADQLRRAMGAWRKTGVIAQFRERLVAGMLERGFTTEFAERVFQQISGFGEYGFPESHAASFALLVYVSAWIKRYEHAAFTAALLNSQPMGFYAPAQLVRDARDHGVAVRRPDVQASDWDCTLEAAEPDEAERFPGRRTGFGPSPRAVRLGLRMVRGLHEEEGRRIVAAREMAGAFRSLEDLARRAGIGRGALMRLARADACGGLALERRRALWEALPRREAGDRPLWREQEPEPEFTPTGLLPEAGAWEQVLADYRTQGLSLRGHPVAFLRPWLEQRDVTPAERLASIPSGRRLRTAGIVLVRQRPGTAKGITFVTLEDETGVSNLIIRPAVWRRYRTAARTASGLLAEGMFERDGAVMHLLVERLEDLAELTRSVASQSRDFH
jgi:error-prone DNA polymerase